MVKDMSLASKNEVVMEKCLKKLVSEFNAYSESEALEYSKMKDGKGNEELLQWIRGNINAIEKYMTYIADTMGIKLDYELDIHSFGCNKWKRELEYTMVKVVK